MNTEKKHIRNGSGSVRPYVYGNLDLLDFVKHVFEAEVVEKIGDASVEAAVRIGDSMIALSLGEVRNVIGPTDR